MTSTQINGDGLFLTDMGNTARFVRDHAQDVRYCPDLKSWLIWNGKTGVWAPDETGQIRCRVNQTVLKLKAVADDIKERFGDTSDDDTEEIVDAWVKWAKNSQSDRNRTSFLKWAESEPRLIVRSRELDHHLDLLNCSSGVVDLKTGKLLPHDPGLLLTKSTGISYDPDSQRIPVMWLEFLRLLTGNDKALMSYLQRAIGYSLTGRTDEAAFFIAYGSNGNNGKSILFWLLKMLLGQYSMSASSNTFMVSNRTAGSASSDIARLSGARLVVASETKEGQKLDAETIKQLTGGDAVVARHLFKGEFEYDPQFKIWLASNHKPVIESTDGGTWRRPRLIPCTQDIPANAKVKKSRTQVQDELAEELPLILSWAVEGAVTYYRDGLQEPAVVSNALKEYRREMDNVQTFHAAKCQAKDTAKTRTGDLYSAYRQWCGEQDELPVQYRAFNNRLRSFGYITKPDPYGGLTLVRGVELAA